MCLLQRLEGVSLSFDVQLQLKSYSLRCIPKQDTDLHVIIQSTTHLLLVPRDAQPPVLQLWQIILWRELGHQKYPRSSTNLASTSLDLKPPRVVGTPRSRDLIRPVARSPVHGSAVVSARMKYSFSLRALVSALSGCVIADLRASTCGKIRRITRYPANPTKPWARTAMSEILPCLGPAATGILLRILVSSRGATSPSTSTMAVFCRGSSLTEQCYHARCPNEGLVM